MDGEREGERELVQNGRVSDGGRIKVNEGRLVFRNRQNKNRTDT